MLRLLPVLTTEHSRPVLVAGEVEKGLLDKVDLLFDGVGGLEDLPSEEYRGGYAVLTSLRAIWLTQHRAGSEGAPCAVPLHAISAAEHKGGMLSASRIKLLVRVDEQGYPTADPRRVSRLAKLKLVCRAGTAEHWHTSLQLALSQRAWISAAPAALSALCPPGAAVAGSQPSMQQAQWGGVQPDQVMVHELTTMGFPARHAANALSATSNAGVQQALDWLLDHEGSPLLEQPNAYGGGLATPQPQPQPRPYQQLQPHQQQQQPVLGSSWGAVLSEGSAASSSLWELGPLAAAAARQQGSSAAAQYGSSPSDWVHVEAPSAFAGSSSDVVNPLLQQLQLGAPPQQIYQAAQQALLGPALAPAQVQPAAGRQLSLGSVGVAGVLKREEQRAAQAEHTLEQAFTDLSNLMSKAADMVELAERFRAHINRKDVGDASDSEAEELDAETALDLINLGIVNPVTKESAGKFYEQQLARQLADFLRGPVERFGGLMPLPDVYCLFNRARGAELVSPDDVLAAAKLLPVIGAPFELREFRSGVKVVQASSHSDEQVCRQLAAMVVPQQAEQGAGTAEQPGGEAAVWGPGLGPGITATDVAAALSVPLAVAGEHLLTGEARGVLCRDDGPEGLRFFRNFFADAQLVAG